MLEKRYAEAAGAYEKALAKGKASRLVAKQHLALLRSGDASKADNTLLGWLKVHPQDQAARAYLAESYTKRGLRREAIQQYEILLSTIPSNAMVSNNLAVLYQQHRDPRALSMAEKAYKLKPDSPIHADTLGWILVQEGDSGRGLQLIEKAVARVPKNPEVRFHFAYALAKAGQTSQARREIAHLQKIKLNGELEQQVGQLSRSLP
jgi:Tfp pilus assembly protein PilF